MGEFFKPWRRKIGVMTLLMALVFTSIWVRSMIPKSNPFVADLVDFHSLLGSAREIGAIAGLGTYGNSLALLIDNEMSLKADQSSLASGILSLNVTQPDVNVDLVGSVSGIVGPMSSGTVTISLLMPTPLIAIPLWLLVITLTFVSAFLLLSKPRQSTSDKFAEPKTIGDKRHGAGESVSLD